MLSSHGDFLQGIADMDVFAKIPHSHLDQFKFHLSKILLVDSNISIETLTYILSKSSLVQHVIYEPISKAKSQRVLTGDCLSRITILKPNLIQLKDIAEVIDPSFKDASNLSDFSEQSQTVIFKMIESIFAYSES